MDADEARLKLADELLNLVEALKDPEQGVGIVNELEEKKELQLIAILGTDTTLLVLKRWTKSELEELKKKAEDDNYWDDLVELVDII